MGEPTLRERVAEAIWNRHAVEPWDALVADTKDGVASEADAALLVVDEAIGGLRRNEAQRADVTYNRALEDVRRMLRGEERRYGAVVEGREAASRLSRSTRGRGA